MATLLKSVRLSEDLLAEVSALEPGKSFSEVVQQAIADWIAQRRREAEDEVIRQALAGRSAEQRAEEKALAVLAQKSARKTVERADG